MKCLHAVALVGWPVVVGGLEEGERHEGRRLMDISLHLWLA